MSISTKLLDYLKNKKVKHEIILHKTVYTAVDAANTLKVKLEQVVKSLLIKIGKEFYLVNLPANKNLDFKKLAKHFKVKSNEVSLPKEKVMTEKFKVKPGTMSAFGSVHKIPVVIDKSLLKIKEAIFSSGSFTNSIKMRVGDYLKLENPINGTIGVVRKIKSSLARKSGLARNKPKKSKNNKKIKSKKRNK